MKAESKLSIESRMSLSEHLAQQILAHIRSKNLGANDKLPSVRTLAQSFSVATPTIREALRRLESTGIIEIRHGSGSYVKEGAGRIVLSNPYRGHLGIHPFSQVIGARLLIEPYLAELAANNATGEDLANLQRLFDEVEKHALASSKNDKAVHAANTAFHLGVARASQHAVLTQVVEALIDAYSYEQLALLSLANDWEEDYSDHRDIFSAIQRKKAREARRVMERHLERVQAVVDALSKEANELLDGATDVVKARGGAMGE